jgi:hypothetical protein
MLDLTEDLLPLAMAAREVPNRHGSRGIHVATLWRWACRGVRGVRLETVLIGGIRQTSRQALQRFIERTTAAANGEAVPPAPTSSASRREAIEAAERELAAEGI